MMKIRQQQEGTCIDMNKQKALLIHNNNTISHINRDENIIKKSLINMANYDLDHYERDESPVSVISHSATVVSQPSSACTSMDHHLHHLIISSNNITNPNLIKPNRTRLISKQKIANSVYHYPLLQEQLSMGTSAASTSEDDNLPTLFFEVAPLQEELTQAQKKPLFTKEALFRKGRCEEHLTQQNFAQSIKTKSPKSEQIHVADSFNTDNDDDDDDDEHMISIDLQGLQDSPMVLRENFRKGYGKESNLKEEERQAVDKISAKLKQYEEWKLKRSTAKGQEELPNINALASKVDNYADNSRVRATNYTNVAGKYEGDCLIGPKLAPKSAHPSIEKASLNLASRKRSINSAKTGVPSKWDDAEKWLCYDNHHVSHYNKVKNSSTSGQNLQRNHTNGSLNVDKAYDCKGFYASPNGENLSATKVYECKGGYASPNGESLSVTKVYECKDNYASPTGGNLSVPKVNECKDPQYATPIRRNLSVNKVYDCRDNHATPIGGNLNVDKAHECKDNVQNIGIRGGHSIDVMSRGKIACASQSSNSNELAEDKIIEDDYLEFYQTKWTSNNPGARQICDIDYMSSGEIVHPHVLNSKLAALSVSDGEIQANYASHKLYLSSQTSISSGSISEAEKVKDNFKQTFEKKRSKDNINASAAQLRMRECDYLSSGEIHNSQNLAVNCASDGGEIHTNYASDQQYKCNASYTQRFKQHLILQKLRRKCSPNNGGVKGAIQNVKEGGAPSFVSPARSANVSAVSRLSNISNMQAIPQKDQISRQGEYNGETQPEGGNLERKETGEDIISEARMQTEFVVQTPTHGRSASMKDACTEVSPSLSRRDMGTQMTPSESSPITSKCTSPLQNTSPARHNTPAHSSPTSNRHVDTIIVAATNVNHAIGSGGSSACRTSWCNNVNALELESCHWAKLELRELPSGEQVTNSEKNSDVGSVHNEWSPANDGLEEETNANQGDYPNDVDSVDGMHSGGLMKRLSVLDSRAAAWEEAEKAKFNAKYKREEARIKAWETLQRAKAEAELKKLEVKLERLRSRATERVLSKVATAERRAAEMRAAAEVQQNEQMRKVKERACKLRKNALFPGSFAVCFARNFVP